MLTAFYTLQCFTIRKKGAVESPPLRPNFLIRFESEQLGFYLS